MADTRQPLGELAPENLMALHRRYVEAWSTAGRIMADAARAVTQRQLEFANVAMRGYWSAPTELLHAAHGDGRDTGGVESIQQLSTQTIDHLQEVSRILLQAQTEAMDVLAGAATNAEPPDRAAA